MLEGVRQDLGLPEGVEFTAALHNLLVYLLDHQYTRRSLAWHRLKNADAVRAAALRVIAHRLDCEIALALADVHESWSCEDEYEGGCWLPAPPIAVA